MAPHRCLRAAALCGPALLVMTAACRGRMARGGAAPVSVTAVEFAGLRWLEGRWIGTEPDGASFYEGYRFADDSTITTVNYADSLMTVATDSGEVRLRDGKVTSGGDQVAWIVTAIGGDRVEFSPLHGARNSFTWRKDGDGWTATLHWPADGSQPARDVVYRMNPVAGRTP